MAPVHRLFTLVDGGSYVARPTAICALLEVLADETRGDSSFLLVSRAREAKAQLASEAQVRRMTSWARPADTVKNVRLGDALG
jgi:hypothetical protein